MDTAAGAADWTATAILTCLRLTVSAEMSRPRRSNGILLMWKIRANEIKPEVVIAEKRARGKADFSVIKKTQL